jgi:hypothetical protein
MIERGGGARFTEQLFESVASVGFRNELERNLTMEHHVIGETDLPHSSAADGFDDLIARLVHNVLRGR